MRRPSPDARCALTAPFHPCLCPAAKRGHRRSALCCTFRRLTTPGRYPAPCPAELGLSSDGASGQSRRPAAILTRALVRSYPGAEGRVPDASVGGRVSARAGSRRCSHDDEARLRATPTVARAAVPRDSRTSLKGDGRLKGRSRRPEPVVKREDLGPARHPRGALSSPARSRSGLPQPLA